MSRKHSLVSICKLTNPVASWNPLKSVANETFQYVDISSINRETKQIEKAVELQAHEAPSRARQLLESEDVLVSTVRPNLNAVAYLDYRFDGATGSTGFTVLRAKPEKLNARYLYYWVRSPYFVRDMTRKSTGASYPAVSDQIVKKSQIPLPPIEEQHRIAAILDKADEIRRKRQEAIALTDELLRSTFLEMFGDPVTNPMGWEVKTLDSILLDIESGWSPKCDSRQAQAGEWGILKLGAVTWGHFNFQENKAILPGTIPRPKLEVKRGDLLFSRKNTYELVGATAFVNATPPRLMLPDLIFRLRLSNVVDPIYMWQLLSQKTIRYELGRLASGSSGSMPNISKSRLRRLSVPVAPLSSQKKYKKIVNNFWKRQDKQKAFVSSANNLFNSLLQKAFKGEL